MQIPLAIHTVEAGDYSIMSKMLNVNKYPVYLLDKASDTYYDLSSQNVTFNSHAQSGAQL